MGENDNDFSQIGNLQIHPQNHDNQTEHEDTNFPNGAINLINIMEDRLNPQEKEIPLTVYSEPKDSTVHLYSELQQKKATEEEENDRKASLKSSGSSGMATRPLPAKPGLNRPGPSSR